jgi:hypothetical protein
VNVLLKRTGCPFEWAAIDNTLEAMQKLVGGYIETVTLPGNMVLVCDEEGVLKGKPLNAIIKNRQGHGIPIVGDFFVCLEDGEEFAGFDHSDYISPDALASTFVIASYPGVRK